VADASYPNTIGEPLLLAYWQDPDFSAGVNSPELYSEPALSSLPGCKRRLLPSDTSPGHNCRRETDTG
jgi:hypothetical protein